MNKPSRGTVKWFLFFYKEKRTANSFLFNYKKTDSSSVLLRSLHLRIMKHFQGIKWTRFIPGILAFILSAVLLTLPGSAFPKEDVFDKIHLDKWIHISMFGGVVFLWSIPFLQNILGLGKKRKVVLAIALIALAYGIAMEFVQKYWIPNRSFDLYDIVADGVGSFLPLLFIRPVNKMVNRKKFTSPTL